ncbi:RHS repeat domain-containing protein, partial [Sphingomicrobium arenosum]|uniref:RHS repeat domain-containing protein n=1 Tax=Sphingomicrobium arenosum TaxID=2233861 RepID=UPI002240EB20
FGYDNLGRMTSTALGNGTAQSVQTSNVDAVGRLLQLANDLPGSGSDLTSSFSYTPAGQIATVDRSHEAYSFDGHQPGTENYTVNGLNQFVTAAGEAMDYDARGNLTDWGTRQFGYDSENFLTSGPNGVSLSYDPLGRLRTLVDGQGVETNFVYDGLDLIQETDGGGNALRWYVHGPGMDNPLVWYEGATPGSGNRQYLMRDERGSIVSVTDNAGQIVAVNSYGAYGEPGAGNVGRFQYTGQTWIDELDLYYYKARFYSPDLGRFMQTDPIGYGDGLNFYNYVGGDPINFADPLGLDSGPIVVTGTPEPSCPSNAVMYVQKSAGQDVISCGTPTSSPDQGVVIVGSRGGKGGGSGKRPPRVQAPTPVYIPPSCRALADRVNFFKPHLPSRVTRENVWNNPANLNYFKFGYEYNVNDWGAVSILGSVAKMLNGKLNTTPTKTPVEVVAGALILVGADGALSNYRKIQAIDARLEQIARVNEGSCPNVQY